MRLLVLFLGAVLAIPTSALGGSDFPNDWSDALTVELGTYEGDVGPHDRADWMRFELPEGWSLHADVRGEANGFVWLEMYADDGHRVSSWNVMDDHTSFSGGKDAVRFGIIAPPNVAFTYSITFTATRLPDVRMENLTVTSIAQPTPSGHTFTGIQQTISFDLVNTGFTGGTANTFIWVLPAPNALPNPTPRPSPYSHRDAQDAYVPAGETVRVTYEWVSWRVVGDFSVYALADMNGREVDLIDNALATRGRSIIAGDGQGIDAYGRACILLTPACQFLPL